MLSRILNYLIIVILLSEGANAQSKTVIKYLSTGRIDMEYLMKEEFENEDDTGVSEAKKQEQQLMLKQIRELSKMFEQKMIDTMTAMHDGRYIKMTLSVEPRQRLYELPTKRFLVAQRRSAPNSNQYDTIFTQILKCPGDTSCDHILVPSPEKGKREILGFSCSNYLIKTRQGDNLTSVWVTNKIKPALPVHAMIRSPRVLLEGYTALEIQEFFGGEEGSYNIQTAVEILH